MVPCFNQLCRVHCVFTLWLNIKTITVNECWHMFPLVDVYWNRIILNIYSGGWKEFSLVAAESILGIHSHSNLVLQVWMFILNTHTNETPYLTELRVPCLLQVQNMVRVLPQVTVVLCACYIRWHFNGIQLEVYHWMNAIKVSCHITR